MNQPDEHEPVMQMNNGMLYINCSIEQPLSIKQPSLLCYFEGENWIWVPTPCPALVLPKQAHANSKSKQQWSSTVPKCASFPTSRASSRGWHSGLFFWAWAVGWRSETMLIVLTKFLSFPAAFMVYPALTDNYLRGFGLMPDPEPMDQDGKNQYIAKYTNFNNR